MEICAQGSEALSANGDRNYVDKKNDFRVVCINNNNNTVIGGGEEPIPEPDLDCEECFAANSTLRSAIINALSIGGWTTTAFTVDSEGELFAEAIVGGGQISTIEELCNEIENAAEFLGVPLSEVTVSEFLNFILGFTSEDSFESSIDELVECLLEKGLIVDRELQPIDSLSANGIDNTNVHSQCTGSPLCAKLEQQ
jgi:hypothetical protein